ncbi:hypothetical protein Pse7367_0276 [Thalassoporum mexicanum PCC 7367]|uniref:hypothetical protein n=1 Tax=Thalassoporum mexicanum TaxID=3457544 RepID=UPI00029FC542|nr:hypothetical protein [Pseudanabaena sp. PCC 7367]AFY68590.1 hypothetical protein Pse7367_0276 [Pseudanabaena sp. PCC 7367]
MKKLLACLICLAFLSGCLPTVQRGNENDPATTENIENIETVAEPAEETKPTAETPAQPSDRTNREGREKTIAKTATVMIFHPDSQCEALVSDKTEIPIPSVGTASKEVMVAATLQNLFENQDIDHFNVAEYYVTLDGNTAIVDITVAPNSRRTITSLSTCEQFALFKAIEATLTENSFDVSEVQFTQSGGENIYL